MAIKISALQPGDVVYAVRTEGGQQVVEAMRIISVNEVDNSIQAKKKAGNGAVKPYRGNSRGELPWRRSKPAEA